MSEKPEFRELFAALRKKGFFARLNWQCCQTCGWAAVPTTHRGPVAFSHAQDMARVKDGEPLLISFGYVGAEPENEDVAARATGNAVRDTAIDLGFTVVWNGRAETRVEVRR